MNKQGHSPEGSSGAKSYTICLIEGDGIGQEVIPATRTLLEALPLQFRFTRAEIGLRCFAEQGTSVPEATLSAISAADATLFGATTTPTPRPSGYKSAVITLRRHFDLYANLRPSLSLPIAASRPGVNLLLVRENSEGLYIGQEENFGEYAIAKRLISVKASERIGRFAYDLARQQGRKKVTIVHKANILPETDGIFRTAVLRVATGYPEIQTEEMLVDAMAMHLVRDPENYDVIVTTNLFGDILSDEASGLVGGLGLAPSANIGPRAAIFEPVHGSAPDIAGRGIANPMAAMFSAALMLGHLGEHTQANRLNNAIYRTLEEGVLSRDLGGTADTTTITAAVIRNL